MKFRWCRVTAEFDGVKAACSLTARHSDGHRSEAGHFWPWRCGRQQPDDNYKTSRCAKNKGHEPPHRVACSPIWWNDGDEVATHGGGK